MEVITLVDTSSLFMDPQSKVRLGKYLSVYVVNILRASVHYVGHEGLFVGQDL